MGGLAARFLSLAAFVAATGVVRPAVAAEYRWIEPGGEIQLEVATTSRPTRRVGPRALAALLAARTGVTLDDPVEPAVFAAPVKTRLPVDKLAPPEGERVAVVRVRRRFTTGDEWARVRNLRLAVRYLDALVVRLNGVELARRNLAPDARPLGLAQRQRGSEWETIFLAPPAGVLRRGENELELEVRPHGRRPAPTIDLTLVASDRARLVRGPIVQRLAATSASIVVEAEAPTSATLVLGSRRIASPRGLRHVFPLEGLPRDAKVTYRVETPDETTREHAFFTPPGAGEPLRFVVYGDVRNGHDAHARVLAATAAEAPVFVLTTGDMVNRGTDEADWQRFFAVAGDFLATYAVFPAIGNHDTGSAPGERRFEDIFALPPRAKALPATYSFDIADVHVVVLDSNRWDDLTQLAWLDADLAAARARGVRAIFAACHHGPWSRGPHGGSETARALYVPVLVEHGVAVLFSGHDHLYQRGRQDGLAYVVSGGGGASIYRPRCGYQKKKPCDVEDGMLALVPEIHYVVVEVLDRTVRLCARRPDGSPLEPCVELPL